MERRPKYDKHLEKKDHNGQHNNQLRKNYWWESSVMIVEYSNDMVAIFRFNFRLLFAFLCRVQIASFFTAGCYFTCKYVDHMSSYMKWDPYRNVK